jgi:hypothetical protein
LKQKSSGTKSEARGETKRPKHRKLAPEAKDPILAPIGRKGMVIGYVDDIHGGGGFECGEYRPTRHELEAIATHWATRSAGIQVWRFYTRQGCSEDMRLEPYASMRLKRIADSIGEEAVRKVIDEVWEAERKKMGEEDWRVFTEGTEAEWAAVVERTYARIDEEENNREGNRPTKGPEGGE